MVNQSIFGAIYQPKFVVNYNTPQAVAVTIEHFVPDGNDGMQFENKDITLESELSPDRAFIPLGKYLTFSGKDYLMKYPDWETAAGKMETYLSYENANVVLFRYNDSLPFKDKNGDPVLFRLSKVIPGNLEQLIFKDVVYLEFTSLTGVDLKNMTHPYTP